jgi:hypothetical protein
VEDLFVKLIEYAMEGPKQSILNAVNEKEVIKEEDHVIEDG